MKISNFNWFSPVLYMILNFYVYWVIKEYNGTWVLGEKVTMVFEIFPLQVKTPL